MTTLELTLPKSWGELTQAQLRYAYGAIAQSKETASAQVHCLLQWTGLEVTCRHGEGWLLRKDGAEYALTSEQIAYAAGELAWLGEIPDRPARLDAIDGARAIATAELDGMSFDLWLSCETLWQGYLASGDEDCLRLMAEQLYGKPGLKTEAGERLSILYWWGAVKKMTAGMFPHFFQPATGATGEDVSADSLRRSMDSQIRALTKGDITKEKEILGLEALRALTELDAQAREYDELNKKYPKR